MTDTTPTWMHFVNFDGRITGETARALKSAAQKAGVEPTELLQVMLRNALYLTGVASSPEQAEGDTKVEPMTINAGNGGFHVVTVVADGYGYLVAEDSDGREVTRVKAEEAHAEDAKADAPEAAADLVALMRAFQAAAEKS